MLKALIADHRLQITSCLLFTSFFYLPCSAGAKGLELMGKLDLFGGQYFFEGRSGSLNGYGSLDLQLAKSYSSDSGFFLSGRSVYTGFKQVNELAGGGTLFQQSLDDSLGFKWGPLKKFFVL